MQKKKSKDDPCPFYAPHLEKQVDSPSEKAVIPIILLNVHIVIDVLSFVFPT